MGGSSESYIRQAFADAGFRLSDSEAAAFASYLRELTAWNARINLTALRDERAIVESLFADSVRYALGYDFSGTCRMLDVGSGAGFPGIPLKIKFPGINLTLLESTGKKAAFLKHIIRTLGLKEAACLAEHTDRLLGDPNFMGAFDVAVTRGTGSLQKLIPAVLPFLRTGGRLLCRKGAAYEEDIRRASRQMDAAGVALVKTVPLPGRGSRRGWVLLVLEKCST